jgi:hypothetical protein
MASIQALEYIERNKRLGDIVSSHLTLILSLVLPFLADSTWHQIELFRLEIIVEPCFIIYNVTRQLGGIKAMLHCIHSLSKSWNSSDIAQFALEILHIVTIAPFSHSENVTTDDKKSGKFFSRFSLRLIFQISLANIFYVCSHCSCIRISRER